MAISNNKLINVNSMRANIDSSKLGNILAIVLMLVLKSSFHSITKHISNFGADWLARWHATFGGPWALQLTYSMWPRGTS